MKKLLKFLFSRVVLVGLSLAIQIAVLVLVVIRFNEYFVYFYTFSLLLSAAVVLLLINKKSNPAYKIAWIILIMLLPLFGGLFYAMFGGNRLSHYTRKKLQRVWEQMYLSLRPAPAVLEELHTLDPQAENQSRYLQTYALCPPCRNTTVEYLSPGERKFERLKQELRQAKHYIFMEYFIIQEGVMWNSILEILEEKVREGVDVRILYDDMGCLFTLPYHYDRLLEQKGIKCAVFNPFVPVLSARLNNRDHRKITVIDGHTGFTGGINLADEYINAYQKHGHWKDSAVMLHGDAVWNLTVMFLSLWNYCRHTDEDFEQFRPSVHHQECFEHDGYVQPYADSPLDGEAVGENVYLNMINRARDYVYINTPYLILDNEMTTALCLAAKSGVDVRIVTPHVPDKWYVHAVTRANYEALVEDGVRIFEYVPGFVHAKTFVSDDEVAVVGTINLDYRSLYLHFECGCWMYRTRCIADLKEDFLQTLTLCQEVTLEDCRRVSWPRKLGRSLLRVFAPLM